MTPSEYTLQQADAEHAIADELAVKRQLAGLAEQERHRLITILALLIGADEALADLHLCLPSVEVKFHLLDASGAAKVALPPRELLRMVQETLGDGSMENGYHLMIHC